MKNGAQGRSLSAIRADRSRTSCAPRSVYIHVQIRDTGAWPRPASRPVPGLTFSLHNGIEPPTRGFLIQHSQVHGFINQ